ncbi:hypothetical protein CY34DRAFT_803068 [Suillus luteus UH-Slu-Lm8-n1]|uniref:Uncharacterized protein n=1 Tax=Suillus luteus UH-Slu-Lm8-n1 TaxID=930992 RepID=A0A0D0B215_9AGAM|nr:hypothetical protein CY34DRAFT_803068 [Suillus luteus UH-Slu-Lm8-n1]
MNDHVFGVQPESASRRNRPTEYSIPLNPLQGRSRMINKTTTKRTSNLSLTNTRDLEEQRNAISIVLDTQQTNLQDLRRRTRTTGNGRASLAT